MSDLTNQYYTKYNKSHDKHGIDFDTLGVVHLPQVAISASQTSGTVQCIAAVPQDSKFFKVSVATLALSGAAGTVQVVAGGAAVGSAGSPNTVVSSGTPLNVTPITIPAAGTQTTVACDVPDAIVSGLPLTVRAVTGVGDTATVQVSLIGCPVDPSPASDAQKSPYNNADPSNW